MTWAVFYNWYIFRFPNISSFVWGVRVLCFWVGCAGWCKLFRLDLAPPFLVHGCHHQLLYFDVGVHACAICKPISGSVYFTFRCSSVVANADGKSFVFSSLVTCLLAPWVAFDVRSTHWLVSLILASSGVLSTLLLCELARLGCRIWSSSSFCLGDLRRFHIPDRVLGQSSASLLFVFPFCWLSVLLPLLDRSLSTWLSTCGWSSVRVIVFVLFMMTSMIFLDHDSGADSWSFLIRRTRRVLSQSLTLTLV